LDRSLCQQWSDSSAVGDLAGVFDGLLSVFVATFAYSLGGLFTVGRTPTTAASSYLSWL